MKAKTSMIFGVHPVDEAIKAGKTIDKVLIKHGFRNEQVAGLFASLRENQIPYQYVPVEKLNRLTSKNHQGIIALISEIEYTDIDLFVPGLFEQGKVPAIVVLDGITDVRNLGAIARNAACAGFAAMVIPAKGSAQINADAIKTSAGALHIIPVCRENSLKDAVVFLKNSGIKVVAATEKAAKNYTVADMSVPVAILMGSEDEGVSPEILRVCDELVRVPQVGSIQSLNVSVAAGVMIYEAVRQRAVFTVHY